MVRHATTRPADASPRDRSRGRIAPTTVIVANRLPVRRVTDEATGQQQWATSPGGLVSALSPILQARDSAWIGWPGTPDEHLQPFEHDGIRNIPVALSEREVADFYEGFANRTLWPLYHGTVRTPEYNPDWWEPYAQVNRRFADAAADIVASNGVVWVHDYHLQLVPAMLRALRPDVRIGFFLHIPFPPAEIFAQLPWRTAILEGMLGADVIGFQTAFAAANFGQVARRLTAAHGDRTALHYDGRRLHAGAFPISVDVERFEALAERPAVRVRAERFREQIGDRRRKIILGVDRLDYTKGIDIRLRAYRDVLQRGSVGADEAVLVQVAVPSREAVEEYQTLRAEVEQLVGEINGRHGALARPAVQYLHRSFPIEELVALYLAADVMLVTPLRDGMNLVAKEYVAARSDERGVLVLSEFTGAAHELRHALLVNPYDMHALGEAISQALRMEESEQTRRMRAMRRTLHHHTVYDWARLFLAALER